MFLLFFLSIPPYPQCFHPDFYSVVFLLSLQYLFLLPFSIIFFLSCKMLLLSPQWEHVYCKEQFAVCLFSLASSLLSGGSAIHQPMTELFLVQSEHAAPVGASPSNNAFVGRDTNHSLQGLLSS